MKGCNIYDKTLTRIGEIDTFISLVWEEGYNTLGSFQLELQEKSGLLDLVKVGNYVGMSDKKTLMLIKSVNVLSGKIIANGFPVTVILRDRVSNEIVNNENAEGAMLRLVTGIKPWGGLESGEPSGVEDVFTRQYSGGTVLSYCETIAQEVDAGFTVEHDRKNKRMVFKVYKPTDNRNLVFAAKFGNLTNSDVSMSEIDYKNVALVAGAGEGADRVTVYAGDTESVGTDRREMYVDARDLQQQEGEELEAYKERLRQRGLEQLANQIKVENVKLTIDPDDFGKRFWLGDNITCILENFGVKLKVKIIGYTETTQRNGTEVELSLGTPITKRRA